MFTDLSDAVALLQQSRVMTLVARLTLLLSVAWLAHGGLRSAHPRLRILIWRSVLPASLVVVVSSCFAWRITVPVLPPPEALPVVVAEGQITQASPASANQPRRVELAPSERSLERVAPSAVVAADASSVASGSTPVVAPREPRQARSPSPAPSPAKPTSRVAVASILVALWGAGVAMLLGKYAIAAIGVRSLIRRSTAAPDEIAREGRLAAEALGYSGPLRLLRSDRVESPCTVGLLRPTILLPASACQQGDVHEIRSSLAHEIHHVLARDLPWNHGLALLQMALWWHPLVWRIREAHVQACDELADAKAAAYIGDNQLYGRLLATLALRLHHATPKGTLAMARPSKVRQRIELVRKRQSLPHFTQRKFLSSLAVATVATVVIGLVSLGSSVAAQQDGANDSSAAATPPASEGTAEPGKLSLPIKVVAAEGGTPLAEVAIRFHGRIGGERFDARLTTDEQGEAVLENETAANVEHLWMTVSKGGYVPVHYTWRSDATAIALPERLDLSLDQGQLIEGQVVDETGRGIEGASVDITMPITWPKLQSYVFTAFEGKTGPDGRWVWDGAPKASGAVSIRAEHPDYLRGGASGTAGAANVITLKQGLVVRGRVVDAEGQPIVGATAQLGHDRFGTNEPQATTDAQGYYELKNCKPGPSAVTIQASGYAPEVQSLKVTGETEPVDFVLGEAKVLRGRVVDADGQPISGATVVPDTWRGFRTLSHRMHSGANGEFVWESAPADAVEYHAFKQGYMSSRDSVLTASDSEQTITLYPELQISGRVTDAETGEPIDDFAIRLGYIFSGSSRTSWSGDQAIPYRDGAYTYNFDEPMEGRLLQVVAQGYLPSTSRLFKSDEGKVTFDFQLRRGEGPSGLVVTPAGEPAVGADVGLATAEKRAFMSGGRFDRRQNRAEVVQTDSDGRFSFLPQDNKDFLLILFHDTGFAELTSKQLATTDKIVLEPWGQISGQVMVGDRPDAGTEVVYSPQRPDHGLRGMHIWDYGYQTRTDEQGRFDFDRVMPGPGTLSRVVVTQFLDSTQHSPCWQTPIEVRPQETTFATVGGSGRAVAGTVVLERQPDVEIDWTMNEPATIERWDAEKKTRATPYARYAANLDAAGHFQVPDVPAGDYRLVVPVNNPPRPNACGAGTEIGKAEFVFSVPPMEGDKSREVLDIGTVTAQLFDTLDAGELAPEFVVEKLAGGAARLSDYHGKLVVLDFWATWCGPCLAEMPTFKQLHERFGDDDRLVIVSLSCDNEMAPPRDYVAKNELGWEHLFVGGTGGKVPRDYTIRALPATFLIAPDGHVVAKNLRGDDLVRAVAAYLEDEANFTDVDAKPRARFPRVEFDAPDQPESAAIPAVVVLDDVDPSFEKDRPHHDRLQAFDAQGQRLWSHEGLNNAQTVGAGRGVLVDRQRGRIYIRENVADRVTAFSMSGQKLWHVDGIEADVLSLDPKTGHLWVSGGASLNSGETVVLSAAGEEVTAFPYRALDLAYDPATDAFWMVGYEIVKLARDGKILFREPVAGWCCASLSINPDDGSVWIVERDHPDVARSENRLWVRASDGSVLRKLSLGENGASAVAWNRAEKCAYVSQYGTGVLRVTLETEPEAIFPHYVRALAIPSRGDGLWVATEESILHLGPDGATRVTIPLGKKSAQSWLVAD